jgi:chromosome partitioning protein
MSANANERNPGEGRLMRTLAVVMQKGGSGKTTLAANLAVVAALAGHPTVLLDADPQASAARLLGERESPVVQDCGYGALERAVRAAERNGAEVCVIDTPPQIEQALLAAARLADITITPVRPTALDLQALETTATALKLARIRPIVVVSQAPTSASSAVVAQARGVIEGFVLKLATTVIHERMAYQHALTLGQGVIEYEPAGKAAAEIRALYAELGLPE